MDHGVGKVGHDLLLESVRRAVGRIAAGGLAAATGLPDDQLGREDVVGRLGLVVEEQGHRLLGHGFDVLAHHGEGRRGEGRLLGPVEGDDGHVLRHPQAQLPGGAQQADRQEVGAGEHRGRPVGGGQQVQPTLQPALSGPRHLRHRTFRQAGGVQGLPPAVLPRIARPQLADQQSDPGVAVLHQVAHRPVPRPGARPSPGWSNPAPAPPHRARRSAPTGGARATA